MSQPSDLSPHRDGERPASPPAGLPLALTSFIGRERESAALRDAILAGNIRLVTLTGPGGVGKTRLAIRVAEQVQSAFPDGVWFLALAPVRDPALVASSIAQALGVRDVENSPIQDRIVAHLRERHALLILDNFEQITEAGPLLAELLAACPHIKILVTSRAVLRISGEHSISLPPLTLPETDRAPLLDNLEESEAVRLFVARAAAARSGFALTDANGAAVAAICRHLDGLALAIELAAARVATFAPDLLLARLDERLPLLIDGPRDQPPRLRSMHDAIAWSYDLLSTTDQTLLCRLSVFSGGFTLDAAESIAGGQASHPEENTGRTPSVSSLSLSPPGCPPHDRSRVPLKTSISSPSLSVLDGIASLTGKSLLAPQETALGEPRFVMLETIREYAGVQLAGSGEGDTVRERHAAHFRALAEQFAPAPYLPNGETLLDQLEAEIGNLRVALDWFADRGDADGLLRLSSALAVTSWKQRGRLREGQAWLERAVAMGRAEKSPYLPAGLIALGTVVHLAGDEQRALPLVDEGLQRIDPAAHPYTAFLGHAITGLIVLRLPDLDRAAACQEATLAFLATVADDAWVQPATSTVLGHLGNIAVARGDVVGAESYFTRAIDRQRALGFAPGTSHVFANHPLAGLGYVARARGDHAAALAAYQDALRLAHRTRDTRATAYALGGVAASLAAAGSWTKAARLFGATESLHETAGLPFDLETMDRQRALGLPEPWQRAKDPFGAGQPLRDVLQQSSITQLPHLPDPEHAARLWAEGRTIPVDDAVSAALQAHLEHHPAPAGLTTRELQVLRLLAAGKSDREIGEALFVSRRTAATHVRNVFAKLEVSSRAAAAAYAVRQGLA